jgi:L-fuculose-phosphate aldolase
MSKTKYADLKKKIIWVCRRMNEMGINQGTSGNVSARTEGGFVITASGIPYDVMDAEHIVEMDLDGGYYGKYLPSTEWRMHMDIFKACPEAGAIVHTHSIYATALSTLRKDIPPFHYMIGVTGGSTLRVSDYAEFGTQALSPITARSPSVPISTKLCGSRARSRPCASNIGRRASPESRSSSRTRR